MASFYSKYIKLTNATGDALILICASALAHHTSYNNLAVTNPYFLLQFSSYSILAWLICSSLSGAYRFQRIINLVQTSFNVIKVVILYILLVEATINILNITSVSRSFLVYNYLIILISITLWRIILSKLLILYRKRGYNYRNVIIVGYGTVGIEIMRFFKNHPEHGYNFLGFFDDNQYRDKPEVIGKIDEVGAYVLNNQVDEIYCCPFELKKEQLNVLTKFVDENLIRMKILPEPGEFPYKRLKIDLYDILPVLMLRSIPLDDAINKFIKRSFDIIFSFVIILFVLSWLLPILAIAIKLDSKGPIFFKQKRSGIDNKEFNCLKLRTMCVNSEANTHQARRGDSRITKVGAFLRKTSLDELPQFFNVLMGQMSVVGPRPHMLKHTEEYAAIVDKFMVRHFVKPGITGLSQVRGFRGDTSELYQMRGRVKLDIFYLENWSFILDIKIIVYTVLNVIMGDDHAF